MWKQEQITMEFITKLPSMAKGIDVIQVIMDRLAKSVHFLCIRESSSIDKLANIYIQEVVAHHGA